MKPMIDDTRFGHIKIEGKQYDHDVVIRLDGAVVKRKKKLSKALYGSSHTVSIDEIRFIYEQGAEVLIVGTGQTGLVKLSNEAAQYLKAKECAACLLSTPRAIKKWNKEKGKVVGLFHVTC